MTSDKRRVVTARQSMKSNQVMWQFWRYVCINLFYWDKIGIFTCACFIRTSSHRICSMWPIRSTRKFVSLARTTTVRASQWIAYRIRLMSAASCVALSELKLWLCLLLATCCSSRKSSSTTMILLSGGSLISSLDKIMAKSALFAGKAVKLFQSNGKGTSQLSMTRLIGLTVFVRLWRVDALIELSLYLSNATLPLRRSKESL